MKNVSWGSGWSARSLLAGLFALALAPAALAADSFLDFPVTPVAKAQVELHNVMMVILFAIGIFIYGLIIYAVINFRQRPGHVASTREHHYNLEIAWTVIPTLILVGMAYPSYNTFAEMRKIPEKPDLSIEIIGHKWFWEYRYPAQGIQVIDSDPVNNPKPMVVPINSVVDVSITSVDVIHSWWVPPLGIKQDATPGHIRRAWFNVDRPATYTGQCAELCGTLHGKMWLQVKAVEPKYFAEWVKSQPKAQLEPLPNYQPGLIPAPSVEPSAAATVAAGATVSVPDLIAKGEKLYGKGCVACHQVNGQGLPGAFPPLAGSEYVTGDKDRHIEAILKGISGAITVKGQHFNGVMPVGGNIGANITNEEIAAIATYERNAWGNKADPILPEDVRRVRAKGK